jgi:hypothetical protein
MANEFKIKKGLIVTGADGGTVVDIQGSQGQLFSVTDDLSGSIFAVSDISGVPILDINSSGDSNFSGDVLVEDNLYLTDAGTVRAKLLLNSSDRDNVELRAESLGSTMKFFTVGTEALELDASQNATFAGDVYIPEYIYHSGDTNTYIRFTADTQTFRTGGDDRLILTNTTATFAGTISSGNISVTGGSGGNGQIDVLRTSGANVRIQSQSATGVLGVTTNHPLHLKTNDTTRVTIAAGGNVGIGTTSPGRQLTVSKASTSTGFGAHTGPIIALSQTDTTVNNQATLLFQSGNGAVAEITSRITNHSSYYGDLLFGTRSAGGYTAKMAILSTGNVGIGTTSPNNLLEISGIRENQIRLTNYDVTAAADEIIGGIEFYSSDTGNEGVKAKISAISTDATGSAYLSFFTGTGQEQMRISNAGSLKLDAYGAGTLVSDASGNITVSSGGGAGGPYLPLSAGASYPLTGALNILIPGDPKLTLQSTSTDTSDWNYINFVGRDAVRDGYVGTDADGDIQVYSDKNSSSVQLTGSGIILNGGNVGIGITNPSTPLQVAGIAQIVTGNDNAFYGGNYVRVFGDQNYGFRNAAGTQIANISMSGNSYFNGGNVGIGTTSPTNLSANTSSLSVSSARTDLSGGIFLKANNVNKAQIYWDSSGQVNYTISGGIKWHTDGSERMRITDIGNVGIGTATPNAKLDVQGTQGQLFSVTDDLSGDIFSVADISGVPIMNVNSDGTSYFDGNVGIGTPSPLQKLSVVSDSNSQTDVSIGNTGNGVSRLYIDASNGDVSGSDYIWFGQNNDLTSEIQITQNAGSFNLKSSPGGSSQTNFTMTQAGNIGIGTTSPSTKLEVTGHVTINSPAGASQTSYGLRLRKTNSSSAVQAGGEILASVYPPNTNAANLIFKTANASANLTQRMVIDGIGNVGIGTTSPSAGRKLDVHGDIELTEDLFIGATGSSRSEHKIKIGQNRSGNGYAYIDMIGDAAATSFYNLRIIRHNSGANALSQIIHTGTGNFEIKASDGGDIILNSSGSIGISQTSPSYKLDVTGDGRFTSTVTAANFILSSDERLKENVEKVCDNKVEVDWKTFELKTEKGQKRYGVIAQELEKTNPEFVREDSQGFKSVAYIDLLIAKIAELEARLEKLEK